MGSKSGGHDKSRGRRGQGKAYDASPQPSEKYDEKVQDRAGRGSNGGAGADFENSNMMQSSQKLCEISLKTTSNEGCGENTSLLKAL